MDANMQCDIAVFSKSYCPYCKATKSLLDSLGAKYYAIELDQVGMFRSHRTNSFDREADLKIDDGSDIQAALKEINGQSSVPNIYIKQQHIGGNSDLQAKKKELPGLLKDANVLQQIKEEACNIKSSKLQPIAGVENREVDRIQVALHGSINECLFGIEMFLL